MRNNADSTPLHTAAQNGHVQVAETLLGGGADVNLLNADGSTALAVAKERGHSALAKLLERAAGKAQLGRTLKEMSERDDSTWKVGEMKNALRFSGVDVDSISEKAELLSLTRDLIANPPVAAAVPDISDSIPAPAPAPAPAPKPGGRAGGFFAAAGKGKRAPAPVEEEESDEEGKDAVAAGAERAKAAGNEAFGRGDFLKAVKHFGSAIRLAPKNHVLYSNRSGAHASLGNHVEALSDAENCIKLAPTWAKGYGRQGAALILCGQYKKAVKADTQPPNFARPHLTEWDAWVHAYTHRRLLKRKVAKYGAMVFMRNKLRQWVGHTRYMQEIEIRIRQAVEHYHRVVMGTLLRSWNRYCRMRGRAVRRQSVYINAWYEWAPRKRRMRLARDAVRARVLRLRTNRVFRNWATNMHNARLLSTYQTQKIVALTPQVHDALYYAVLSAGYAFARREEHFVALQCWQRWMALYTYRKRWTRYLFLHRREAARHLSRTVLLAWHYVCGRWDPRADGISGEPGK